MLKGRRIILGISGGIAAYKTVYLLRMLKKEGAEVRVVATNNALEFVTKVTLESLSQNKVYNNVFGEQNDYTTEHISLTDWGELFVVAPATANIIGKYANGIADDALSTSLLAFDGPVYIAPSMNSKMYLNFSVQRNLKYLSQQGVNVIEPSEGFLACGWEGKGRMEEPENILVCVKQHFENSQKLAGKKVLISAGPTYEAIDPVRFIGNHSSGKMGFALAEAFAKAGADVTLVAGPVSVKINNPKINRVDVVSAHQMYEQCVSSFAEQDIAVMAAAVADYTPLTVAEQKIKKKTDSLSIELKPTQDILAELGRMKSASQLLIGFALETNDEVTNAQDKLKRKNLDAIVLNSLNDPGAGFAHDTNKINIITRDNQEHVYSLKTKQEAAADIVEFVVGMMK